jgi:hypothetical protein
MINADPANPGGVIHEWRFCGMGLIDEPSFSFADGIPIGKAFCFRLLILAFGVR